MANEQLGKIAEGMKDLYDVAAGYLFDVHGGQLDTERALEGAITSYRSFATVKKNIDVLQSAAKTVVEDIMRETGQVKAITPAGTAQFTSDSVRVSYDTKALDALCASDGLVKRLLAPHRKETPVAGSLTIK